MTSLWRPRTVRSSLWPCLVIIWTFVGPSANVKLERRIFYAIMMTVMILFVSIYSLGYRASPTDQTHVLGDIGLFIEYLKIPTILILIWLWGLRGADTVENCVVELTNLDHELRNFCLIAKHERFMWKQLFTIIGFPILFLSFAIMQHLLFLDEYDSSMSENSWTFLFIILVIKIQYLQIFMIDLVFAMILEAFRMRFELVNKIFKCIAESEDKIKVKVFTTSYSRKLSQDISGKKSQQWTGKSHPSSQLLTEKIDRACRIHRRLLKVIQEVQDVFSMQLCVSTPIVITIIASVALAALSSNHAVAEDNLSTSANALSTLFIVAFCWKVARSCSNTSDEVCNANDLGPSLYRVPIEDAAVHKQLQEYSVYIVQRKLRFTIGGIWVVDKKFVKSVFSTFVKYLVILIQFRRNEL